MWSLTHSLLEEEGEISKVTRRAMIPGREKEKVFPVQARRSLIIAAAYSKQKSISKMGLGLLGLQRSA